MQGCHVVVIMDTDCNLMWQRMVQHVTECGNVVLWCRTGVASLVSHTNPMREPSNWGGVLGLEGEEGGNSHQEEDHDQGGLEGARSEWGNPLLVSIKPCRPQCMQSTHPSGLHLVACAVTSCASVRVQHE
jgi:hypothetical protein